MKRIIISKLFLYRHRFLIGYIILGLLFVAMLLTLPLVSQTGISEAEMQSATDSYYLTIDAPITGDLVNLPYRILQKISIMLFGLTPYAIKLPSILVGLALGLLIILLLNRWFKNNVSLLASILVVLSTPFLYLSGNGTPLIMLVFWPTLLLWLGSKIQGEKKPKPAYSFFFAIALFFAIFTPYMAYFAIVCIFFVLAQPHLRFIVKSLPKIPLLIVSLIITFGISILALNFIYHPETILKLLLNENFDFQNFAQNILTGFTPVFNWTGEQSSTFLGPLVSLPMTALSLIGLFSTTKGFFASRNSIATLLLIFTIAITGFNPMAAVFIILPLSILIAHGLKYLVEKWYSLFPENAYARIVALFPLAILFGSILIPSGLEYLYGYRYNPEIAEHFTDNLPLISENLTDEAVLVTEGQYDFYKILEHSTNLKIIKELDDKTFPKLAILENAENPGNYTLNQIITSPKREKSDIIYLYSSEKGENNGSDDGPNEAFEPAS